MPDTFSLDGRLVLCLAWLSILFAIACILARNPIFSVLYLILIFLCLGGTLILLEFYFVGLLVVFIYVGAISVLFLFVLMIVDLRILFFGRYTAPLSSVALFGVVILGIALFFNFYNLISHTPYFHFTRIDKNSFSDMIHLNVVDISYRLDPLPKFYGVDILDAFYGEGDATVIGVYIFNYFSFQLLIIFCILIACMLGAIAVVIDKLNLRPSRHVNGFLQLKSADFSLKSNSL